MNTPPYVVIEDFETALYQGPTEPMVTVINKKLECLICDKATFAGEHEERILGVDGTIKWFLSDHQDCVRRAKRECRRLQKAIATYERVSSANAL